MCIFRKKLYGNEMTKYFCVKVNKIINRTGNNKNNKREKPRVWGIY